MPSQKIGIIGLGAIGASLGMCLKSRSDDLQILGRDQTKEIELQALALGVMDGILTDEELANCQFVIIATPLRIIPDIIDQIQVFLKPGTIVSDVGSVKAWVMDLFQEKLPPDVYFIGGHPMAGSEKSGLTAADKFLFENAAYVLTPHVLTPPEVLDEMSRLIALTGARLVIMKAEEHDQTVARVSHLPHLMAATLMNNLQEKPDTISLGGGGLRDMTRIAASSPELWEDILSLNADAVSHEIRQAMKQLNDYLEVLEQPDHSRLRSYLQQASTLRRTAPVQRRHLQDAAEVIAIIPDQPGMIGEIGRILGEHGMNIQDIHILGIRDEDEGTLRLTVKDTQATQTCAILKDAGIKAWVRS